MKRLFIILCLLLPLAALADWDGWGGSPVRRPAPASGAVVTPYLYFGIPTITTCTAPIIVAATLSDTDVTWMPPAGTNFYGKTPLQSLFTNNGGQYALSVSDWSQVTTLNFDQTTASSGGRFFLTNMNSLAVNSLMTSLTNITFFRNGSTSVTWNISPLPATITVLAGSWYGCSGQKYGFPFVSNLVSVSTLATTWKDCGATGAYPYVNSMTNVRSLSETWRMALVGGQQSNSMPDVSNLIRVTTLASTWSGLSLMTGSFPVVSTLTTVADLVNTWRDCELMTNAPIVNTLTNVNSLDGAWNGCFSLVSAPDISTLTKVTTVRDAFNANFKLTNTVPVVSGLTNITVFQRAFLSCISLTGCVENFNGTLRKVTTYDNCFASCSNLIINIGSWDWTNNITDFDAYQSKACYTNRGTAGCFARGGPFSIKTNGFTFRMDNCMMSTGDLTQILVDFDSCGTSNMNINLGGTTAGISNLVPELAGWQAITNMRAAGRTNIITVNGP